MKQIQANQLTADQAEKIFPNQYYQKYGSHLKILEFEKLCTQGSKKKNQLKFVERRKQRKSEGVMTEKRKVRIHAYDTVDEVLEKNKEELKRVVKISSTLEERLSAGPSKKENIIKSPMKERNLPKEQVILRLTALDNMQFEEKIKQKESQKQKEQKLSTCKFIPRSQSDPQFKKKNSIMQHTKTFQNKLQLSNTSKVFISTQFIENVSEFDPKIKNLHFSENVRKAGTWLATSKKVSSKKKGTSVKTDLRISIGRGSQRLRKEDLLHLTRKIREEVNSVKPLYLYEQNLKERNRKISMIQ